MLLDILRWVVFGAAAFLISGTVLNLSNCSHWFVRGWDFPRAQIAALLMACALAGLWLFDDWLRLAFVAVCVCAIAWHLIWIANYTPLHPVQVRVAKQPPPGSTFRLVATNVLMQNTQHDRWLEVICSADPDLVLAAETNERWINAIQPLRENYPYALIHPLENMYGLTLLSRLELLEPETRFLVEDDVPSFHTRVCLANGAVFTLRGLHPRPPQPRTDQNSTQRDAELVIVGREVDVANDPTVVAGDLNDVAWSHTTRLFQRISGTLDPRVGRGFLNSYNANSRFIRWPLDHVFHTEHFQLVQLRRLPGVGSDHFPILIELALVPEEGQREQEPPEEENGDHKEAAELMERETKEG